MLPTETLQALPTIDEVTFLIEEDENSWATPIDCTSPKDLNVRLHRMSLRPGVYRRS